LARRSKDVNQSGRLLSLAAVRDGIYRRSAAKIGGVDRQTLRDWVHRFNASGPDGLIDNWNHAFRGLRRSMQKSDREGHATDRVKPERR
jgi:transposase